mgnify:CR=1 FL=1
MYGPITPLCSSKGSRGIVLAGARHLDKQGELAFWVRSMCEISSVILGGRALVARGLGFGGSERLRTGPPDTISRTQGGVMD